MCGDAVLDQIAEEYLGSEFSLPEWRVPFHRYLADRLCRPTQSRIHGRRKGGSLFGSRRGR